MKYRFIAGHRGVWGVVLMCSTLGVSRSGYYALQNRLPSAHKKQDDMLGNEIYKIYLGSHKTYGARRIRQVLLENGHTCGLHRVGRLMRKQELLARPRKRWHRDHGRRSLLFPISLTETLEPQRPTRNG